MSRGGAVSPGTIDPFSYVNLQDQSNEKFEYFMIKFLQRHWPAKIFWVLGFLQLGMSCAIFSVDIIVVLMLAPRWQVMIVIWTFFATLAAAIGTLITRKFLRCFRLKIQEKLSRMMNNHSERSNELSAPLLTFCSCDAKTWRFVFGWFHRTEEESFSFQLAKRLGAK